MRFVQHFVRVVSMAVLALIVYGGPVRAAAADDPFRICRSGDFGYILLEDGSLEIIAYYGNEASVTIPGELDGKPVTAIGEKMLCNNQDVTELTISEGIVRIGEKAFWNSRLTHITLPSSVTEIGEGALGYCIHLQAVDVPEANPAYEVVGDMVMDSRSKELIVCFRTDSAVISVPEGVVGIGEGVFKAHRDLTEIVLPDSLEWIGDEAFSENCMTSLHIPANVSRIGKRILTDTSVQEITVSDQNPYYTSEDGVLIDVRNQELVAYPPARQESSYEIPDTVNAIGSYAFDLVVGGLQSVSIPSSVSVIDANAFYLCVSLTDIYVNGDNPTYAQIDGVLFEKATKSLILYPLGKKQAEYSIPTGIRIIEPMAFGMGWNLQTLYIPDTVTDIREGAFAGSKMQTIEIDEGNEKYVLIDDLIFDRETKKLLACVGSRSMEEYSIPEGTKEIAAYAFYSFMDLRTISIPSSVECIDEKAFEECVRLRIYQVEENSYAYFRMQQLDTNAVIEIQVSQGGDVVPPGTDASDNPEAVPAMSIYDAYNQLRLQYNEEFPEVRALIRDYALADLNHDGTMELLVGVGFSEGDKKWYVYTYRDGNAVLLGEIEGWHKSAYVPNDGTEQVYLIEGSVQGQYGVSLGIEQGVLTTQKLSDAQMQDSHLMEMCSLSYAYELEPLQQSTAVSPGAGITELSISGQGITDLSAYSTYTDLKSLDAYNNLYSDLSPLSGLTGLESLVVAGSQITTLEPIRGLVNLRLLAFGETAVSDISVLSAFPNLQIVDFWYTPVSDISVLAQLVNLEEVYISYTNVTSLEAIMNLPNIRVLSVSGLTLPKQQMEEFQRLHPGCQIYQEGTQYN